MNLLDTSSGRERPLLYSGPMVVATLRDVDPKTQTRRVAKLPHENPLGAWEVIPWGGPTGGRTRDGQTVPFQYALGHSRTGEIIICPNGQPGDRLWGRETFFAWGRWETRFSEKKGRDEWHFIDMTVESGNSYLYAADGVRDTQAFVKRRSGVTPMYWKRPAIFMPRAASRIELEITGVRVERLQDISESDALAEGIEKAHIDGLDRQRWRLYQHDDGVPGQDVARYCGPLHTLHPLESYRSLWLSINGPGSWSANPWVWVVEFRRLKP